MKLERKLAEWQQAGLIDEATVRRIVDHETGRAKPIVLYAVGGVGAVAIALGVVAIVASNWAAISAGTKLGIDLIIAVGLAVAVLRASPGWLREILIIVNYGFVLASMALIGQVYQLDSGTWRALLVWTFATGPLMLLARGRFSATLWTVGLATTFAFVQVQWWEWLDDLANLEHAMAVNVAIVTGGVAPLAYQLAACIPWLRRERPAISSLFRATGWLGVACLAFLGASLFYDDFSASERAQLGPIVLLIGYGAFATALPRFEKGATPRALLGMRALVVVGPVLLLLAVMSERGDWPILAAMLQIGVLGSIAWTALHAGHESLFRLGVALVCLRLLVIYIEVFGSMLQTGLGLIIGGALTIGLTWFWLRKSGDLAEALGERGGHGS